MPQYQRNQRVEGYYDDAYYSAKIFDINSDGTYVVHFDDGDILEDMVETELRLPQALETTDTFDQCDFNPTVIQHFPPKVSDTIAAIPAFKPKQAATVDVQVMLAKVEAFLLPKTPTSTFGVGADGVDEGTPPYARLMNLLHELSIGEHIRALQFLYRDGEDDLKLAMNIRNCVCSSISSNDRDNNGTAAATSAVGRITSKKLMRSIAEGRCRAVALCRICYGSDSIESLKALVDLSNIYAVQGRQWLGHKSVELSVKTL